MTAEMIVMQLLPLLLGKIRRTQRCSCHDVAHAMTAKMIVMQLLPLLLGKTRRTQRCSCNDCWND
jgi:hypothetical protein